MMEDNGKEQASMIRLLLIKCLESLQFRCSNII